MYIPKHFVQDDPAILLEVMQRHDFATLITTLDDQPFATHVPVLAHRVDGVLHIRGHMARANPHWQALHDNATALVVFNGPHTYISPTLYQPVAMVPTWNYIAVHASGKAIIDHSAQTKLALLHAQVAHHEPSWQVTFDQLDTGFIDSMLNAIVAFDITVSKIEGKFKLGQHRLAQNRLEMQQSHETGDDDRRQIADWMKRLGYWE